MNNVAHFEIIHKTFILCWFEKQNKYKSAKLSHSKTTKNTSDGRQTITLIDLVERLSKPKWAE